VNPARIVLDGVAENVVLARAFAAAALHVLEVADDDVDGVRLIVSELVTALIADGAGRVVVEVTDDDPPALIIGSEGALPGLTEQAGRIIEASLGVGLATTDGCWRVPLRVVRS
jgi:anti-sigma regulatory factor (Ser/Thr protein kinase)